MSNVVHRLCIYGYRLDADTDPDPIPVDYRYVDRSLVAAKIAEIFSCPLLAVTTLRVRCFLGWLVVIIVLYRYRHHLWFRIL